MRFRAFCGFLIIAVAGGFCACSSSPAQPSAVVGVPTPTLPTDGAQIAFSSQPVTLVVSNATISGTANATYTFEIATDSAFATKVQTKQTTPNTSGQTSVVLDSLATNKDYYWHVRAQSGSTTGKFSSGLKFTIVPLSAPAPVSPANGATVSTWPTLVVADAQTSGQTGTLMYRFEVSTSSAFDAIVATGTVPETPNQTSFTPVASLPGAQTTMYWRATATDQSSGTSSPTSAATNFVLVPSAAGRIAAQEGITLWPSAQPQGTPGQAVLGDSWNVQMVTSHSGVVHQTPTLDELRVFDVMDHGFDPQGAINWINSNGYRTSGAWYPGPQVIGFEYEYMALISGRWNLVFKVE
jgi:hypothetical protein